ncbi:MAG: peptidyl-prolyl cis-trans isomerase [Prosthecobacter sp.]|jgi:peptidyl-prolyl cis-trans isomerase C|nr:peptidyl-prolyl cis-trans isomerase [Prosthecobacter sp.]
MSRVVRHFLIAALLLGIAPGLEGAITMDSSGTAVSADAFTHNQWLGNRIRLAEDAPFQTSTSLTLLMDVVYPTPFLSAFILGDIGAEPNKADIIAQFDLDPASAAVAAAPGGVTATQLVFNQATVPAGVLEPGKSYWIVAGVTAVNHEAQAGQQMGLLDWSWASSQITTSDGWTVDDWIAVSNTNGADWNSFAGAPYAFGMTTIIVPEPSRALLLVIGLAALLRRRRRIIPIALTPLVLAACQPAEKPESAGIAVVGTETIGVEEFQAAALRRGGGDPSSVDREALLDELITESALVQRAQALKLNESAEFRRRQRALLIAMLREKQPETVEPAAPTDAQLKALYEEMKPMLQMPAARHLAVLRLTENRERLAEALKRFQPLPPDPARRGFGALAVEFSDDQDTRYIGGDIGWLSLEEIQRRLPAPVAKAALQLSRPQTCSDVIVDGPSAYVILLQESRAAATQAFEKVRPRLMHEFNIRQAADEARKRKEDERKGLLIEIDSALLRSIPLPSTPPTPLNTPPLPR